MGCAHPEAQSVEIAVEAHARQNVFGAGEANADGNGEVTEEVLDVRRQFQSVHSPHPACTA